MKAILIGLLSLSFLTGVAAAPNGSAEIDYKAMFLKHWQISKDFTLAVADAMPAEDYNFKPNAEEMSFGEMMINLAYSNSQAFASAAETKALAKPSGTDKQTAIRFLTDSFDQCAKDFAATTPEQLARVVHIRDSLGGRDTTEVEVIFWAFTDTAHHRGQAEVYLRVKNIKPPGYRF
jgi:uncharacterized damage-inducible protein DinB